MQSIILGCEINEKIYEGDEKVVFRGIRTGDNKPVIIKTVKSAYPAQKDLAWLKHEYEILQTLNIAGVVKPLTLEKHNNGLALILEDFDGKSLFEYTSYISAQKQENRNSTGIDLKEFLDISIQLSTILKDIHDAGIIHKDINPRNILINTKTCEIKIIDFSLASIFAREEQKSINPGLLDGTLAYISPELTGRMNRSIDYRTDFYSLGITFYELITGTLPFCSTDPMELIYCHIAKAPVCPHEINKEIPEQISAIVMKLISKNAEDRYKNAFGLKCDLLECLNQFNANGIITGFILGQNDISDRFQISQKLYGRGKEIANLMAAFDRVAGGSAEMMIVSGYSGIGKSSLINEIHKPITSQRGYFISGKFDQYKKNIPYSGFIQAFRELIRHHLTESEDKLNAWKQNILNALGPNGQIIIDVIPDLEFVIGKQQQVMQLGSQETQNRFNLVFIRFVEVFTKKEHPLVIFLDDLQWVDSASLNLVKTLMTNPDSKFLLMIGAYRDNEVRETHPLIIALDHMKKSGVFVNNISLLPLNLANTNRLIADSFNCEEEKSAPLSNLVSGKTNGNPFFVNQFLRFIYEEGLLKFEIGNVTGWRWDIDKINKQGITDNVVDLMVKKIVRLSKDTQNVLMLASCIGNQFDLKTLSVVNERPRNENSVRNAGGRA
ncbi:MAG: AAA family ATPase [Candidatus Anammoxibacter sp.]